mgnify:CR=1 FL=1
MATFSFFVIQYRVEHFIYRRVKKIYDDVSLLESTSFRSQPITTDMETLTKRVKKCATDKKLEIETLKVREEYRREFLGNVSHELKTPLFTVQGYLLTLEDGAMDDKKISKKYLKRANKGVERLISIVKDLDLISKLESADLVLNKQPFNILELVQEVFELLEMKAKKRGVSMYFNKHYLFPIMVIADAEKIEQVLTNLIVNAIKYSKKNGTIMVSVEKTATKVLVKVIDDGEGIKEEYIPRLFERFY